MRCPDAEIAEKMHNLIAQVKADGDTIGGIITGVIKGAPVGLGDPAFGKLLTSWFYQRTDQLRNCCKIGKPKIVGNTISIEIYLDIDSLQYDARGADPYKTVVAANAGLHGGWDVSVMEQIPWGMISSNDGAAYGNGTQIWKEPIEELFTKGKLIESFKRNAKARGLNLK
mgnify:CR=1 FL=1